jgi:RNA recognition motif-containing protein
VFVGNLDFHTTPDGLANLLSEAGQITDVHMPSDRLTGRPRGFAFVEFSSEQEADAAIERFHGHELDGRELRLDKAEARPQSPGGPRNFRSGGPGGGGPGGGRGGYQDKKKKKGGSRRGLRARKRSL